MVVGSALSGLLSLHSSLIEAGGFLRLRTSIEQVVDHWTPLVFVGERHPVSIRLGSSPRWVVAAKLSDRFLSPLFRHRRRRPPCGPLSHAIRCTSGCRRPHRLAPHIAAVASFPGSHRWKASVNTGVEDEEKCGDDCGERPMFLLG